MDNYLDKCRNRLFILWIIGIGLLIIVLIIPTIKIYSSESAKEAWGFFFQSVLPSISLIVSSYIPGANLKNIKIDKSLYRIIFGSSIFYLLLVLFSIIGFTFTENTTPVDFMNLSNLWLGPIQGIIIVMLGYLFIKRE